MNSLVILAGMLPLLLSCTRQPSSTKTPPRYSPYVLQTTPGHKIEVISFKDVGHVVREETQQDQYFKAVAQGLQKALLKAEPPIQSQMSYWPELLKAHNHLACGHKQLYVDLWRSDAPPRWGYSLWRGCSLDDRLAWNEVEAPNQTSLQHELSPALQSLAELVSKVEYLGCTHETC